MANNEISLTDKSVTYQIGQISFNDFDNVMTSAKNLASHINSVEVTPENIQQSKKLRASINRQVKFLNEQRIKIKHEWQAPYKDFDDKVKEITQVADDANDTINQQVKSLEQQERQAKKNKISKLFDEHKSMYDKFPLYFEDFMVDNPKLLNKATTLDKAEDTIAEWMMSKQTDITAIQSLPDNVAIMAEYVRNGANMADAISTVQDRLSRETAIAGRRVTANSDMYIASYTIRNKKDAKMLEMFMNENNIKFEKVEK